MCDWGDIWPQRTYQKFQELGIPICFLVRNAPHSENHCEKTRFLMRLCCSPQECWGWKRLKTTGIANVRIKEIPLHTHLPPTKGKVYFQHFHFYNFPYEGSKGTFLLLLYLGVASWVRFGRYYMAVNFFSEKYLNKLVTNIQLNYCINIYYRVCQIFWPFTLKFVWKRAWFKKKAWFKRKKNLIKN